MTSRLRTWYSARALVLMPKKTSGHNMPRPHTPSPKDQPQELLFINQYRDDHNQTKHGPDRSILGSYVQRHIHRTKRIHSTLRLMPKTWIAIRSGGGSRAHQADANCTGVDLRNRSRPTIKKVVADEKHVQNCLMHRKPVAPQEKRDQSPDFTLVSHASELPRDRHGLRFDPFTSYPIKFRESIPAAIDYFLHYYAPFHSIRPDLFTPDGGMHIIRAYFRYALQHPLMFETIVALSRANLAIKCGTNGELDPQTLHHYGQALTRLRRLVTEGQTDAEDAVLFAILALICVEYMKHDLKAFQMHLNGLRRIVASRGGVNALGWPKLLKPSITSIETFWSHFCRKPHLHAEPVTPPQFSASGPVLPRQPTLEILIPGELVDSLPPGFRVLALQKRLRTPVIVLVSRVRDFHLPACYDNSPTGLPTATNLRAIQYCRQILTQPGFTTIERACCIGLLFVLLTNASNKNLSKVSIQQIQQFRLELLHLSMDRDDNAATNLFVWACLNMATSLVSQTTPVFPEVNERDSWSLLIQKVRDWFGNSQSLETTKTIMRRFFLTDACAGVLENAWNLRLEHIFHKQVSTLGNGLS